MRCEPCGGTGGKGDSVCETCDGLGDVWDGEPRERNPNAVTLGERVELAYRQKKALRT